MLSSDQGWVQQEGFSILLPQTSKCWDYIQTCLTVFNLSIIFLCMLCSACICTYTHMTVREHISRVCSHLLHWSRDSVSIAVLCRLGGTKAFCKSHVKVAVDLETHVAVSGCFTWVSWHWTQSSGLHSNRFYPLSHFPSPWTQLIPSCPSIGMGA